MPTPFYHLSLAKALLDHPDLPESVTEFLRASICEFMFGNTAPDVQVVSGQAREETHFFSLPIQPGDYPAWEMILAKHPQLNPKGNLSPDHTAFLAGYLCHLQADWFWVKEIFTPVFGPRSSWGTFHQRLYYHNVLRAYLDQQILSNLSPGMDTCLARVRPVSWLPFVEDQYLRLWRDFLTPQLQSGATVQTVEVFSVRQGISAQQYYALLASEQRMEEEVFEHLPREQILNYKHRVLDENVSLLKDYLAFTLHLNPVTTKGSVFQGVQP
jgi:hypothetical protein